MVLVATACSFFFFFLLLVDGDGPALGGAFPNGRGLLQHSVLLKQLPQ
jgi:hypothetical protein